MAEADSGIDELRDNLPPEKVTTIFVGESSPAEKPTSIGPTRTSIARRRVSARAEFVRELAAFIRENAM